MNERLDLSPSWGSGSESSRAARHMAEEAHSGRRGTCQSSLSLAGVADVSATSWLSSWQTVHN